MKENIIIENSNYEIKVYIRQGNIVVELQSEDIPTNYYN